ncbi:MAG: ankyrin repeat domain-containing protein [Candidatus Sulfopaludibacter sp.]|nr:ankyrin repeat domain-containing protein [Candidatus Sulfopaludibacter sp.]
MRFLFAVLVLGVMMVRAADLSTQILSASASGKTPDVQALIEKGAPLEAHDKEGRTPLMLAAQHGYAETVRVLLAKGARADARDKSGFTAYGLALLAPAGRNDHEQALRSLPQPPHARIAMDAVVAAGALISSCFMPPLQLKQEVTNLDLGAATVKEIVDYARTSGKGIVQIVQLDKPSDADAQVTVEIQPGAACEAQTGDSLNLAIEVRVFRAKDHQLLQKKLFAGGFKGLRKQTVTNAAQYGPVYLAWIKPQAGPMYWFMVQSLFQTIL